MWAFCINITMATSKTLSPDISNVIVAFMRSLFGLMFIMPMILKNNSSIFKTQQIKWHLLRVVFTCLSMIATYYTYRYFTLTFATAIGFSGPLITSMMAVLILKEKANLIKWIAIITGYAGVLVLVNPTQVNWDINILIALFANITASTALILTKKLSNVDSKSTILAYSAVLSALMMSPFVAMNWQLPQTEDIMKLVLIGGFAIIAQLCYISALSYGPASLVAALEYIRVLVSIPIDIYFFNKALDSHVIFGTLIIATSTCVVAYNEKKIQGIGS